MLKRTEGIVLKSMVFGEADLIVTYLTLDCGLLRVFAKSPRKVKSRFGSSLEPLTYSRISFFGKEHAGLPRLTQSDILRPFHVLREDFSSMMHMTEMLELNLNFLPDHEPHPDIFSLLLSALLKLEKDKENPLYCLSYKIKFLKQTGYSPRLDACGRCGSPAGIGGVARPHHHFYVSHGAIMCPGCIENRDTPIRVSGSALKFYRGLSSWKMANLDRVKAPEGLLAEIVALINSHIAYIRGSAKGTGNIAQGGISNVHV